MAKIDFRKLDTYRKSFDGILQVKKHVGLEDDLPVTGAQNGDIYTVGNSNTLYIYNGSWAPIGSNGGGTARHMVVNGIIAVSESQEKEFVPNDGQPTFSEAVEAFESGIPVMLVMGNGDTEFSLIVFYHISYNGVSVLGTSLGTESLSWKSDGNTDSEPDPSPDPGPNPIQ